MCWRRKWTVGLIIAVLLPGGIGIAQNPQLTEYQLKALYLFNFAKFVEWPESAFSNPGAPLVIGVLGENPFGDLLETTVQGKALNRHPLEVREIRAPNEVTNCHILFISGSEKKHLPEILKGLQNTPILTVSEMDRFTENGGMINFVWVDKKVHFQINDPVAKAAGLKIGSKLLGLSAKKES
jgi:hypothetical protein